MIVIKRLPLYGLDGVTSNLGYITSNMASTIPRLPLTSLAGEAKYPFWMDRSKAQLVVMIICIHIKMDSNQHTTLKSSH